MSRQEMRVSAVSVLIAGVLFFLLMGSGWFAVFRATGNLLPIIYEMPLGGQDRLVFYEAKVMPLHVVRVRSGFLGVKLLADSRSSIRKAVSLTRQDQDFQVYYQASLCQRAASGGNSPAVVYHDILALGFSSDIPLSVSIRKDGSQIEATFSLNHDNRYYYIFDLPSDYQGLSYDFLLDADDLLITEPAKR